LTVSPAFLTADAPIEWHRHIARVLVISSACRYSCSSRRTPRLSRQSFYHHHNPHFATGADLHGFGSGRYFLLHLGCSFAVPCHEQQLQPLQGHLVGRVQETIVTHLMKPLGQDMLQKATQEFHCRQGHGLPLPGSCILVTEGYLIIFQGNDAVARYGNTVDITGQVLKHLFRLLEGRP